MAGAPRTEEAPVVAAQLAQQEARIRARVLHPIVASADCSGLAERIEEQRVPCEEHFVVEARSDALLPAREERGSCPLYGRGRLGPTVDGVEDVASETGVRVLEISGFGHAEERDRLVGIRAAHFADLGEGPAIELSFDPFGIGILGGE